MKILIVDDDKTTRRLLSLYLKGKGYETVTAENGLEAMDAKPHNKCPKNSQIK